MLATPLGFVLSLVGLFVDRRKTAAIAGLAISGFFVLLFLIASLS